MLPNTDLGQWAISDCMLNSFIMVMWIPDYERDGGMYILPECIVGIKHTVNDWKIWQEKHLMTRNLNVRK